MAEGDGRTPEALRREIADEREELVSAVEALRSGLSGVTSVTTQVRSRLPVVAAGALGAGFVLAGGIGAAARLVARRTREGKTKAQLGRFAFVKRR